MFEYRAVNSSRSSDYNRITHYFLSARRVSSTGLHSRPTMPSVLWEGLGGRQLLLAANLCVYRSMLLRLKKVFIVVVVYIPLSSHGRWLSPHRLTVSHVTTTLLLLISATQFSSVPFGWIQFIFTSFGFSSVQFDPTHFHAKSFTGVSRLKHGVVKHSQY